MKLDRTNPVWLLVIAGVAFVGWVIVDAATPDRAPPAIESSRDDSRVPTEYAIQPVVTVKVRAGMARMDVESQLSRLKATRIEEVELAKMTTGFPTYRMTYRVELQEPLFQMERGETFVPGPYLVDLEFDARRTGHPLLSYVATRANNPGAGLGRDEGAM